MLKEIYGYVQDLFKQARLRVVEKKNKLQKILNPIQNTLQELWEGASKYLGSFNAEDKAAFRSLFVFGVLYLVMGYFFGLSYVGQSLSFLQNSAGISMGPFFTGIAEAVGTVLMFMLVDKTVRVVSDKISSSDLTMFNGKALLGWKTAKEKPQIKANEAPNVEVTTSRAIERYNQNHPNVIHQKQLAQEAAAKQEDKKFRWQGANTHMGVLSTARSLFPSIIIGTTSTKTYVTFATVVQTLTFGLVRPGNLLADVPTDNFGESLLTKMFTEEWEADIKTMQNLVNSMSKPKLYEMLERKDITNTSVLEHALSASNVKIFKTLFNAIEPDKRVYFLTRLEDVLSCKKPLAWGAWGDSWAIIKNGLSSKQLRELISFKDQKGDNLLQSGFLTLEVLSLYSLQEKKQHLKELCSHGYNMVVDAGRSGRLLYIKDFLSIMPENEWAEVLNHRPGGWSMTLGEKMMVFCHAFKKPKRDRNCDREEFNGMMTYLKSTYGLELPKIYQDLPEKERSQRLAHFKKNTEMQDCGVRHNFVRQHGGLPEAILGIEEPYPLPMMIKKAYRQQQLHCHPDRQMQKSAIQIEMASKASVKLNAANQFLTNDEEWRHYFVGSAREYHRKAHEMEVEDIMQNWDWGSKADEAAWREQNKNKKNR
tara:strand:- start:54611 stop:56557 length:1947 start_codon:yes stop_codon:yes gene_type:complete